MKKLLTLLSVFTLFQTAQAYDSFADFIRAGYARGEIRNYYMTRNFYSNPPAIQEAFTLGGQLLYDTPYWNDLSAGLAFYTSQRLVMCPETRDGTDLLAPGQKSYSVLGQSYLKYRAADTVITVYRQMIDTPFINPNDTKMTPITYEAYTLSHGKSEGFSFLVSHVTGYKYKNSTQFVSMSDAAGYTGTNHPLTLGGVTYNKADSLKIQLWNYYAYDFMNTSYFQLDAYIPKGNWKFNLGAQALAQVNTGESIAGDIHASQIGGIAGAYTRGWTMAVAYTQAANGHDIVNPWGGYPGYTSIMEEDCDLEGERSWLLHLGYDMAFIGLPGLLTAFDFTQSHEDLDDISSPRQREGNFVAHYTPPSAQALTLTLKLASVSNSRSMGGVKYTDSRFIARYRF
ncbi:MAG: OprD family outer membrane porin [Elusimicrobiaceae bacterium]